MSHWTKIKLQLTDEKVLEKALTRMGLKVETGKFTISQYGQSGEAEIRVDNSVGFQKQKDGTYSMIGDFYHASGGKLRQYYGKNEQFQKDLNTAYGIEDVKQKLEDLGMGFEITENEEGVIGKDGMIRMVATSWA
jgi:hypothetical protein